MSKRAYCSRCEYPQVTCVCEAIESIEVPHRIIILQHPSEVGHAKGTVRLIRLAIPTAEVYVGERPEDFIEAQESISSSASPVFLIFPDNSGGKFLQDEQPSQVAPGHKISATLVLIDGTWRKAKKILALNEWLQQLPRLTIQPEAPSEYRIRSSRIENSLSTLEALAYTLEQLQDINTEPLYKLFRFMQQQQLKFKSS